MREVVARAPGKVILFGEHAVNRGQAALSAAVGMYCECVVGVGSGGGVEFVSGGRVARVGVAEVLAAGAVVDGMLASGDFGGVRAIARADFFAPQKYVLSKAMSGCVVEGLRLKWSSDVPANSGLGSGGSAFVAMVGAVAGLLCPGMGLGERAAAGHLGDVVAHGGIASALDTQTSLLGGVIRFTGSGLAEAVEVAGGLRLVVAHCGVAAATGEVNGRVREWLAMDEAARLPVIRTVGALTRAAVPALRRGDWAEVGRLMLLNQLVLDRIGVNTVETGRLVEVALRAGAAGAKVSGSGGGGIVVAIAETEGDAERVEEALRRVAPMVIRPEVAVGGVAVEVRR